MGFLRNHEPGGERFVMREQLLSVGDDFWIENDQGERAYKVDGKALRVRQTFVLERSSREEIARIQERKLSILDTIAIERGGFAIDVEDGDDMKAHGNIVDHEYEIERDGDTVATISKKWFRVPDSSCKSRGGWSPWCWVGGGLELSGCGVSRTGFHGDWVCRFSVFLIQSLV